MLSFRYTKQTRRNGVDTTFNEYFWNIYSFSYKIKLFSKRYYVLKIEKISINTKIDIFFGS